MTKRLIDVDDVALNAARAELGTRTIKDTVNEALRRCGSSETGQSPSGARRAGQRRAGRPFHRLAMSFVVDTSVMTRLRVPAVRERVEGLDGA